MIDKKLQSASAICSTFPPCGAGNILKTEDIMQAYDKKRKRIVNVEREENCVVIAYSITKQLKAIAVEMGIVLEESEGEEG